MLFGRIKVLAYKLSEVGAIFNVIEVWWLRIIREFLPCGNRFGRILNAKG
jgi:hypothetical protein